MTITYAMRNKRHIMMTSYKCKILQPRWCLPVSIQCRATTGTCRNWAPKRKAQEAMNLRMNRTMRV